MSNDALTAGSNPIAAPIATVLRFTDGNGEDSYVFGVPATPNLLCANEWFQAPVFDAPAGAFASILALSNGLRAQVGS